MGLLWVLLKVDGRVPLSEPGVGAFMGANIGIGVNLFGQGFAYAALGAATIYTAATEGWDGLAYMAGGMLGSSIGYQAAMAIRGPPATTVNPTTTSGSSGQVTETTADGDIQATTDRGQAEGGTEGRAGAAKELAESPTVKAPGRIAPQGGVDGKPNYDFLANSGEKQSFNLSLSLTTDEGTPKLGSKAFYESPKYKRARFILDQAYKNVKRNNSPWDPPDKMKEIKGLNDIFYMIMCERGIFCR